MGYQEMDRKIAEKMVELAIGQLAYSYAPYSGFKVGAALLAENGKFYTGSSEHADPGRRLMDCGNYFNIFLFHHDSGKLVLYGNKY